MASDENPQPFLNLQNKMFAKMEQSNIQQKIFQQWVSTEEGKGCS